MIVRCRCPVCHRLFWSDRSMCAGGWPIYDPQVPPGSHDAEHDLTAVVRDESDQPRQ